MFKTNSFSDSKQQLNDELKKLVSEGNVTKNREIIKLLLSLSTTPSNQISGEHRNILESAPTLLEGIRNMIHKLNLSDSDQVDGVENKGNHLSLEGLLKEFSKLSSDEKSEIKSFLDSSEREKPTATMSSSLRRH